MFDSLSAIELLKTQFLRLDIMVIVKDLVKDLDRHLKH